MFVSLWANFHKNQIFMETRAEHLKWCKQRALEYVDAGDLANAFGSFVSDMKKHPETINHPTLQMGARLLANGHLNSETQMRHWINGFN